MSSHPRSSIVSSPRIKSLAAALSIALAGAVGTLAEAPNAAASAATGSTSRSTWTHQAKLRAPTYEKLRAQFALLQQSPRPAPGRAPGTFAITSHADFGAGSLREALTNAVDGDVIDLRTLHGTISLTDTLQTNAKVEIRGPGQDQLTIDAGGKNRAFVASHGLRMSNVTIANGTSSAASYNGGCLFTAGYLYLGNVTLNGCKAGDADSPVAYGGAVSTYGSVNFQNVTITNSLATGYFIAAGGAVSIVGSKNDGYDVKIGNSTITGNSAAVVEGYFSYLAVGGAIAVIGSTDQVTYPSTTSIVGSTISGNSATNQTTYYGAYAPVAQGGAANFQNSVVSISDSQVTGNSSAAYDYSFGGGIATSSPITVTRSSISGNSGAGQYLYATGGGLFAGNSVTCDVCSIQNNTATGYVTVGGGVAAFGEVSLSNSVVSGNAAGDATGPVSTGGGLSRKYSLSVGPASTTLTNSTISGNSSASGLAIGGGVYEQESLTTNNSTIAFNNSATYGGGVTTKKTALIALFSTIISNNTATAAADSADLYSYGGPITATGDHNLIIASDSGVTLPGDTLTSDPLLLPLAYNGGVTQTHALDPTSPAIDTGSNPLALATDQRGVPYARVVGVAADIGAYELDTDHIFGNGFE